MLSEVWRDLKWEVRVRRNVVVIILLIQVAVFVLLGLIRLGGWLMEPSGVASPEWMAYLGLPADPATWVRRPWTVFTYAWVHSGIWHLLFNGLIFYWFGRMFSDLVGPRHLLKVFGGGILMGALAYWGMALWMGWGGTLIGSSAAVMATMVAAATLTPSRRLYLLLIGPVKIAYIAVGLLLLDLIMMPLGNPGGHVAHLGGALWGFLYVRWIQGRLPGWMPTHTGKPQPRSRAGEDKAIAEEVDRILEKIVRQGMDSLTDRERRLLDRASERARRKKF